MFVCLEVLTLLKLCAFSFLCGPRADLYPFYEGFNCNRPGDRFLNRFTLSCPSSKSVQQTYMDIVSEVSLFLFKSLHICKLQKRAWAACVISFPSFLLVASARQSARESSRVRTFGTSCR